jgi:hypothetical protein
MVDGIRRMRGVWIWRRWMRRKRMGSESVD